MRRFAVVLVCLVLCSAVVPLPVAAADRVGGTVVVGEDEQVDGFSTAAGTVIVKGTVDGNVDAYAGTVIIEDGGEVTGQLRAAGGSATIAGTVGGSTVVYGGSLTVAESAELGGSLGFVGATATVAGTVNGDVTTVASSVTLEESALITGTVSYGGSLTDNGATVEGQFRGAADNQLLPTPPQAIGPLFAVYALGANALLGVLALAAVPGWSRAVEMDIREQPARTGAVGLAASIAIPLVLTLAAITVVGIPLTLAGLALFAIGCWIGSIYGQYALGRVILARTTVTSRYAALGVGLFVVAVGGLIPILGDLLRLAVVLFGLGATATVGYRLYERVKAGRRTW